MRITAIHCNAGCSPLGGDSVRTVTQTTAREGEEVRKLPVSAVTAVSKGNHCYSKGPFFPVVQQDPETAADRHVEEHRVRPLQASGRGRVRRE